MGWSTRRAFSASFWALVAVLLGLRAAGATLGWGFQFQSPVFLELMAGLLFFLGLSLAGQFEIGLTLTSAGGSLASRQGYTGSFFTGVLAVVVATPCTAPFMGAALGYALAQNAAVTFAVFTALALGLAAPYFALTLHPAWTRLLPKPGAWMEVMKQAVAVPIFLTAIGLAWVLAQAYGANLLAVLLPPSCCWPSPAGSWAAGRPSAGPRPSPGWFCSPSSPSASSHRQSLPRRLQPVPLRRPSPAGSPGLQRPSLAPQAAGRPVLVDFTAKWCLSCQVNERVALERPEVQQALAAQCGPLQSRLDPPRRGHHPGPGSPRPQRRSRLRAL